MSTDQYEIRQVGAAQFELLIPLMKDCFGLTVDIDYFRWKYTQNPAGDFIGFIAVHKETGEAGAYYGVIPELYSVNGREKIIYQSCDTMTHSAHRRRGLFQLLALHCYEYMEQKGQLQVYGFGGAQSTPGFLKFGWSKLFELLLLFYPRQLNMLRFNRGGKKMREAVFEVTDITLLGNIIANSNTGSAVYAAKKMENFRWRIANPLHQYQVLGYRDNNIVEGYIIFYRNGDKLFIFDWAFTSKKAEKALFATIKNKAAADKSIKGLVSLAKKGSAGYKLLRRNSFLFNPFKKGPLTEKTPFITYMKGEKAEGLDIAANWEPGPYDHDSM